MLLEAALTWSWLNVLTKRRYDALREVFGDLGEALENVNAELLKGLGCRDETVVMTLQRLKDFDVEGYKKEISDRGLEFISIEDPLYPDALKTIPDSPIFLYAKGSIEILDQPCIACVGTRQMSQYGKRVTEEFIPSLVSAGMTTISGLAQGVDAHVARVTLDNGGKTVAVLGHGLSRVLPRCNSSLADEIFEKGGLILSEFPLDQVPDKYTFPARNRIIAGLSLGTIVLEAGEGSGALITSDLALDYGREAFAVPGQIFDENYKGCNKEISKGHAKLVASSKDVLEELGIIAPEKPLRAFKPQNEEEEALHAALTTMPQSTDDLVEKSRLHASTINTALTMLELKGIAKNVGSGMWVRC